MSNRHVQPAAEIITFRLGELRGLSRWKARLSCVGLEEALLDKALEHAGMLLVQLERLLHIISDTTGGVCAFFPLFIFVLFSPQP
jgi:anaphase-promoting complex subunit 4